MKPQAAARLRIIEGPKAKLERICVLKEARAFGIGHKLLEALETEAIANEAKEAVMHAQVQALPFYEKKGYKAISEPFEEAGITHVKMTKTHAEIRRRLTRACRWLEPRSRHLSRLLHSSDSSYP